MAALMEPPTRTSTVAIYDRDGSAVIDGLRPAERLAACYRHATARELTVLEQVTGYASAGPDPALDSLLEECRQHSAGLLVYSLSCLAADSRRVREVTSQLGALPLIVAAQGTEAAS